MYSPPFRSLTADEDAEIVEKINAAKPDFVWVGLGAPKQERWMAAHENRVQALMLGVGAAFDYEAGNIRRAPAWMQRCNLEWLYRLMQDPKRLFKRYFVTNTKFCGGAGDTKGGLPLWGSLCEHRPFLWVAVLFFVCLYALFGFPRSAAKTACGVV